MSRRFDIREDANGWTVFDVFTGEPVVIAMVPQTGLEAQDGRDVIDLLERPHMAADRTLRQ
jgi:hypothetical protein